MSGGMFVIQEDGQLVEMHQQAYDSEAWLQELLARHPNLLAGDQIDASDPRRWILVRRENAIPAEKDGPARWSVDHLFLDQDAVPTLVEVKRSTDTRIRREVVGQMLDYAANAVVYCPVEEIRAQFELNCQRQGRDPDTELQVLLGESADPEQFWERARTNLEAGKIRLLFVADQIPGELRRVVEFLNSQMSPAEVLAVEIRQYANGNLRTLVPRVLGQTARKSSNVHEAGQWDEASFFADLRARRGNEAAMAARAIFDWAKERRLRLWWGRGKQSGSFFPLLDQGDETHWTVSVWTYGTIEVQFQMMKERSPFNDEAKRQELLQRLNTIPGVSIAEDAISRRPSIPLNVLAGPTLAQFLGTLDWLIGEIRRSRS
jgi:hypothetical protein